MPQFTAAQRAWIKRQAKASTKTESGEGEELNIVPFLDIVMNVTMFLLASITTVFTATTPVEAPTPGPSTTATNLTVKIVPEGYIVASGDGYLQPGCTTIGAATVAVPLRLAQHDGQGLTDCLVHARARREWSALASQRNIQIATNGNIPYHVLVRTLDATRETRPGAHDLFTSPTLGIMN
jgi:hypothetical protein